jgi:hypothetical protein
VASDEAVLRIILQDGGRLTVEGGGASSPSDSGRRAASGSGERTSGPADEDRERKARERDEIAKLRMRADATRSIEKEFERQETAAAKDVVRQQKEQQREEAKQRREEARRQREEAKAQRDADRKEAANLQLKSSATEAIEREFEAEQVGTDKDTKRRRLGERDEAERVAQDAAARDKFRRQQEQAADRNKPFDPREAAIKRREGERRAAQVNVAYKKEFGDEDQPTTIDAIVRAATQFRGVIGGVAGVLVGGILDVTAAVRRAQKDAQREGREARLVAEAEAVVITTVTPPAPSAATAPPAPSAATGRTKPEPMSPEEAAEALEAEGKKPPNAIGSGPSRKPPPLPPPPPAKSPTIAPAGRSPGGPGIPPPLPNAAANAAPGPGGGAGVGSAAGSASVALVALGAAAVVAVAGFNAASAMADDMIERYKQYSAPLSAADALVDARQTLGDLRRAQEGGPDLAKFLIQRGELQQRIEDAKLEFMKTVMPLMLTGMRLFETVVLPTLKFIVEGISKLTGGLDGMKDTLDDIDGIAKEMKLTQEMMKSTDLTEAMMNAFVDPAITRGREQSEADRLRRQFP